MLSSFVTIIAKSLEIAPISSPLCLADRSPFPALFQSFVSVDSARLKPHQNQHLHTSHPQLSLESTLDKKTGGGRGYGTRGPRSGGETDATVDDNSQLGRYRRTLLNLAEKLAQQHMKVMHAILPLHRIASAVVGGGTQAFLHILAKANVFLLHF